MRPQLSPYAAMNAQACRQFADRIKAGKYGSVGDLMAANLESQARDFEALERRAGMHVVGELA